jgi:hypothetical protein
MISRIGIFGMRRIVILIIVLTTLSGYALAHTPAGVDVSYDENSGDLVVAITHQVDDPATHFVNHVTVQQGTTVLIDTSYTSQPDKSSFTNRYNLPQLKGSTGVVRVDVGCNIIGSRSGTLVLTRTQVPDGNQSTPGAQQPAASPTKAGALPFVVLLAAGFAATRIMR